MEKHEQEQEQEHLASIPYFLYQDVAYRFERSQKALLIVTVVALILAIGLVVGMILMTQVWSQAMHECDCQGAAAFVDSLKL